jgi:transposase
VRIWAASRAQRANCPHCGRPSGKVHSRYQRTLADASIGGQQVLIRLRLRRFFCHHPACPARTFAEQIPGLTTPYARRSQLARRMLEQIALALAGRAGERLADRLGLPVGRSTLLRLVRTLPDPDPSDVAVLGVDDFALRRGHNYGGVLVDMATHHPVDLLADREADTFADWLRQHPGTKVICRDRAGAYADGARQGAPAAVQVADRWHLWHNLAQHVDKLVARHRGCRREPEPQPQPSPGSAVPVPAQLSAHHAEQSALVKRTQQRYAAVQALRAQGKGIKPIMRELGLAKETVRRFYRAHSAEELLAKPREGRPSILDPFKPYLHQRCSDGHTCATRLFEEIRVQGYHGSAGIVRNYLRPFRQLGIPPPPTPTPPKVRDVTSWLLRHPDSLDADEQPKLKQVLARCPDLDAAAGHVASFAEIMTGLGGGRLGDWIARVEADQLPELHSFVAGLNRDLDAVVNGLSLPYSSGAVEGNVNRIILWNLVCQVRVALDPPWTPCRSRSGGLAAEGQGWRSAHRNRTARSSRRGSGPRRSVP